MHLQDAGRDSFKLVESLEISSTMCKERMEEPINGLCMKEWQKEKKTACGRLTSRQEAYAGDKPFK